ncbi:hypothetical protein ACFL12_05780 [Pseudomonadota bacterium]
MGESYIEFLKAFGFKEMQIWIATISALLFSGCFLGGLLSAMTFVNSNQLQQRPLKERISFRLFILAEFILLVFVFFYHVFMIEMMTVAHAVYWISATMMMPLLAIIGSQVMLVAYSGKVKAKEAEVKRRRRAQREQRAKEMDASEQQNPAQKAAAKRKTTGKGPAGKGPAGKGKGRA